MNLNLKQLEAFIWVVDLGSFRKAAERLNTTQPNISARISALESALDTLLMERDAGSVRLTGKGELLLKHAREVIRQTELLVEASGTAALYDGTLRLGVTEMIVHTWLRLFINALKEKYPNITVELTVDLSANLKKELHDRSIDLAFQNGPFSRTTSGTVELGTYPWIWVASPSLEFKANRKITARQLAAHPILTHSKDTQTFNDLAEHFRTHCQLHPRLVPSSNLSSCLHMTLAGMGIATVPACMVTQELKRGELVRLKYSWTPDDLQFQARYYAEKTPHYVARAATLAEQITSVYVAEHSI